MEIKREPAIDLSKDWSLTVVISKDPHAIMINAFRFYWYICTLELNILLILCLLMRYMIIDTHISLQKMYKLYLNLLI